MMAKFINPFGGCEIFPWASTEMTKTPDAREFLSRLGDSGVKWAKRNAPVDTGAYRDSIGSEVTPAAFPEVVMSAGSDHWMYLEYGTVHNRPFRILSNALIKIADTYELY